MARLMTEVWQERSIRGEKSPWEKSLGSRASMGVRRGSLGRKHGESEEILGVVEEELVTRCDGQKGHPSPQTKPFTAGLQTLV